jgi:hypothetical protein
MPRAKADECIALRLTNLYFVHRRGLSLSVHAWGAVAQVVLVEEEEEE